MLKMFLNYKITNWVIIFSCFKVATLRAHSWRKYVDLLAVMFVFFSWFMLVMWCESLSTVEILKGWNMLIFIPSTLKEMRFYIKVFKWFITWSEQIFNESSLFVTLKLAAYSCTFCKKNQSSSPVFDFCSCLCFISCV